MSDIVLSAKGLGKRYVLHHEHASSGYSTLREKISESFSSAWTRLTSGAANNTSSAASREEFWALRDVCFDIKQGEFVGFVGRNGAGKSTLLKIISRITEPTTGLLTIRGRVASLLEVGTGFHPELTGRENIFLNGAILGMSRVEIRQRFDRIVAFAEVDRFLDTPVKRYSSGMYVRLAFAVAAHLEPDILIIDEVLAVGDAAFQRKCMQRMSEVATQGRTILFVSHNLGLVRQLCRRGLLLEGGKLVADDRADVTVGLYLQRLEDAAAVDLLQRSERRGKGHVRLSRVQIVSTEGSNGVNLEPGRPVQFVFHATGTLPGLSCSFTIYDQLGQAVTYFDSAIHAPQDVLHSDESIFLCELDQLLLFPGRYRINAALIGEGVLQDHVEGAATFEVHSGAPGGRVLRPAAGFGSSFMQHRWRRPC